MGSREPLNRDRVAAAGLGFIDAHGATALSMRKLGADLGVEAMSLYNHVANKDELLDAIGDLLYVEILDDYRADSVWTWQRDVEALVRSFRSVAGRHPNALELMTSRLTASPAKLAFLHTCYRVWTKAGFSTKRAALAFDATSSWLVGAIHQEFGLMAELDARETQIDPGSLSPELRPVVEFYDACGAWTPDQRFDFGLAMLIAGLESQLPA